MIKIHHPEIFKEVNGFEAVFTEANRIRVNREGSVPGLNLGYNTDAPKSEVDKNFETLFEYLGWEHQDVAIANQVHGTHIEVVTEPGIVDNADGLVTVISNLALGIRVADCAAILIADPVKRIAGAFHAGWKGAAGGIVNAAIDKMNDLGGDPANFRVFISPCISLINFEVGEEVAAKFPDKFIHREEFVKPHIDLKAFIFDQLIQNGVTESYIQLSEECTMEDDRFFSYRREREGAGRMLAMIKIN